MQNVIRLAACLVMAATSTPAFAGTGDRTGDLEEGATRGDSMKADEYKTTSTSTKGDVQRSDTMNDEAGSASGEPQGAQGRGESTDAAVKAWNHEQFLQEVWAPTP